MKYSLYNENDDSIVDYIIRLTQQHKDKQLKNNQNTSITRQQEAIKIVKDAENFINLNQNK